MNKNNIRIDSKDITLLKNETNLLGKYVSYSSNGSI